MGTSNEKILEEIRRVMYAGVGAVALSVEKAGELLNRLSEKGEDFFNTKNQHGSSASNDSHSEAADGGMDDTHNAAFTEKEQEETKPCVNISVLHMNINELFEEINKLSDEALEIIGKKITELQTSRKNPNNY